MVEKNPYRVLASYSYDEKERSLRSERIASKPPMTDTGSDDDPTAADDGPPAGAPAPAATPASAPAAAAAPAAATPAGAPAAALAGAPAADPSTSGANTAPAADPSTSGVNVTPPADHSAGDTNPPAASVSEVAEEVIPRKKSKLSELFKVPSTPTKNTCVPGTPRRKSASYTTPPRNESSGTVESAVESAVESTVESAVETRCPPSVGKGKGRKGATAFIKGSPTQQAIWKAQERIQILDGYLTLNPVRFRRVHIFRRPLS